MRANLLALLFVLAPLTAIAQADSPVDCGPPAALTSFGALWIAKLPRPATELPNLSLILIVTVLCVWIGLVPVRRTCAYRLAICLVRITAS